jgi:urea transport system permease protein
VIVAPDGLRDAASGEALSAEAGAATRITVNNRLRRAIGTAQAALALSAPQPAQRLAAANTLRENAGPALLPVLARALEAEPDAAVREVLLYASAKLELASPDPALRLKAAQALGASSDAAVKNLLAALLEKRGEGAAASWVEPDAEVRAAAAASMRAIDRRIGLAQTAGTLFSGLSLGSILLLAALGLAITYGVMGVINMAHGELLMVGAYATFAGAGRVPRAFARISRLLPAAAMPAAFLAAALVGIAMERLVIRHLYGRPLETLLATWGLSLVLIQAARVLFGPQNVELANPSWMSGGVELAGGVVLPYNRIVILGFAAFVLVLVWLMMQKTRLGMFVRAVTQNRPMAGCVGVPTARVGHAGVRDRLRHRRAGRAGAVADRQRRPGHGHRLHRRRLHGGGARRRRPARRRGMGGARPRHRRQVPRRLGGRGRGQDPGAGLHHRLHPEASAGHLRPQGPLRRQLRPPPCARPSS